jgi:hypothetical protein
MPLLLTKEKEISMNDLADDTPGDVSNYPAPITGTPRLVKFLRTALQNPDHDDLFQEVLNIGYTEWQQHLEGANAWGFANMVNWMRETFGDDAALIMMLGKFNQQVYNGGIIQWLDNGYASDDSTRHRRQQFYGASPEMDTTLLDNMVDDLQASDLSKLPHGHEMLDILLRIQDEISDADGSCPNCNNHRYVKCENCDGTGENAEGEDCEECDGEGEIPCPECNEDGHLEMDAREGSLNNMTFDRLDQMYYEFSDVWEKEVTDYLKSLVRQSQPGDGLLSRAQAFKATEKLLVMIDRLLEAIEDETEEGDVSSFIEPTQEPYDPEVLVNEYEDLSELP